MSNKTRLEAVSSALDTAINTANSLPDAGGSSGGESIKTCTIQIGMDSVFYLKNCFFSVLENGEVTPFYIDNVDTSIKTYTITNVVCGSVMYIDFIAGGGLGLRYIETSGNVKMVSSRYGDTFWKAPTEQDATGTIYCWDD